MKDYLTAKEKELARIERVHPATVTRWIARNLFPNARLVGKTWRIPIAEYEQWREATKARNCQRGRLGNRLLQCVLNALRGISR